LGKGTPGENISGGSNQEMDCGDKHTDSTGEHLLVVDVALHPGHEVFDVFRGGHFSWAFVVFRVLPEVLESKSYKSRFSSIHPTVWVAYSSVAFISGHVCGEQNSVIEP
jgi:hypothetical protein